MAGVKRVDDLGDWFAALLQPASLVGLGALAVCALVAAGLVALMRPAAAEKRTRSVLFGRRLVDGVLFPFLWLGLAVIARGLVARYFPAGGALFHVAIPALMALAAIRMGVKVLHLAFASTGWIVVLERTISWVAWGAMVMWVSGLLPLVLDELDQITWKVGSSHISVRTMIEGALTAGAVLIVALWVSSAIESRLLREARGGDLSLRMAASNATRALLLLVGLLLALSAVGIDLTALSVLGGALGVGVGLGLQRLAANYVSGFVILAERSMRIGDNVRVDNFEGRISDIKARYTVIRSMTGREAIVPNELLITNRVENLSLADSRVLQTTVVSVGYGSDIAKVRELLLAAALQEERVLRDPAPTASLSAFGADGLEFTLGYWIADPENGQLNVRSAINIAILEAFRREQVEIPFPQRVVHTNPPPA